MIGNLFYRLARRRDKAFKDIQHVRLVKILELINGGWRRRGNNFRMDQKIERVGRQLV